MKKWLVIGIVVVVAVSFFFLFRGKRESDQKSQVATAKVNRTSFTKTVQSSGKTKAKKGVSLQFQTSGRLQWVGVKEGDPVKANQAIAGLDVREVRKNLEKALRDYSSERNDFEEARQLTYSDCGLRGNACTDTITRILQKNQWNLEKAVLDVELDSLAVEFSTLISPIAGVVTHIDTPVAGVNITPAGATFEVVDPGSMVFEVNADETDVGNLSLGQKAQIALDAYPDATFSGTISYISFASQVSAGGATVFPVQIKFDEPQKIRIGLNGDVTIDSVNIPDALTVPIEAIREETGGKYVYKKKGTKFIKTRVHTGMQNDTEIIVDNGVSEGDEVVTKGFTNIKS